MAPAGKSLETVLADTPENREEMSAEEQAAWTDEETAKYKQNTKKMMTVR